MAFLFNPFHAPVLRRVLRAWSRPLADRPGELDILYVNDEQKNVLAREPGFARLFRLHIRRWRLMPKRTRDSEKPARRGIRRHALGGLLHLPVERGKDGEQPLAPSS